MAPRLIDLPRYPERESEIDRYIDRERERERERKSERERERGGGGESSLKLMFVRKKNVQEVKLHRVLRQVVREPEATSPCRDLLPWLGQGDREWGKICLFMVSEVVKESSPDRHTAWYLASVTLDKVWPG